MTVTNFGIAAPAADGKIVLTGKTTRLYVYGLPVDKHLNYVSPYCEVELGQNATICANETAILTTGGDEFAQYNWSNGATTPEIEVNTPGDYILQAATAFGCKSSDTVVVTVLPTSASTLNASACAGESYNYNGTQIPAGETQAFTFVNAAGCDSIVTVIVEALSASASTLNASACAGESYNYNGIQIPAGETQAFTFVNAAGCDSVVTVIVEALSASASTLNASACLGGFYNYNGAQIPAGQSQQFTLTNAVGCDSVVTVIVASNPLPLVDLGQDSTVCEGQTVTLDAGNPGATYNWSNGASTQTVTVGTSDLYAVTVTNTFGCTASNDVAVSVVICPGTDEPALRNVSVFPNPTSGALTVQFAELPSKTTHLTVVNTVGQTVLAKQQVTDLHTALDLSGLPKGLYLLRLQSGTSVSSVRVVVQ